MQNEWKPISEAPKDGAPILAYRKPERFGDMSTLTAVVWNSDLKGWVWPDHVYDAYDADVYREAVEATEFYYDLGSFTHFMLLPEPPDES